MPTPRHDERSFAASHRLAEGRGAGANHGLLSSPSLIVGVAASGSPEPAVLVAGLVGPVAGAMSMAAGEHVSLSPQADTEAADIAREGRELAKAPEGEVAELAAVYVERDVDPDLARQVSEQMMARDALGSHLRDELGLTEVVNAAAVQAALASAVTFAAGAAAPVVVAGLAPATTTVILVMTGTVVALTALRALGAMAGGDSPSRKVARVVFWGVLAMAVTAGVGRMFGTVAGWRCHIPDTLGLSPFSALARWPHRVSCRSRKPPSLGFGMAAAAFILNCAPLWRADGPDAARARAARDDGGSFF